MRSHWKCAKAYACAALRGQPFFKNALLPLNVSVNACVVFPQTKNALHTMEILTVIAVQGRSLRRTITSRVIPTYSQRRRYKVASVHCVMRGSTLPSAHTLP